MLCWSIVAARCSLVKVVQPIEKVPELAAQEREDISVSIQRAELDEIEAHALQGGTMFSRVGHFSRVVL
jgi:hypothetical protein